MPAVIFHPDVVFEVKASYDWYQSQASGLGDDLMRELETACQTISELPDTWPRFNKNYRRFLLSKFPYPVIYRNDTDTIFVVAVMHNSRKPGYWKNRS